MELEQRSRLDARAKLRNPALAHEQRGEDEDDPIELGQIRRAPPGSITDQKLMFEQQRLCGDGAYATGAKELRERDDQVDGEDEDVAHGANRIMIARARKTAPCGRITSYYDFATLRENCAVALHAAPGRVGIQSGFGGPYGTSV